MPDTVYGSTRGIQDSEAFQVYRAYEDIMRQEYPGAENMVGAEFWGTNELATTGLHNEVLFHTGLLGAAAKLGRDLRTPVPMATYETVDQVIADYELLGIGFEYYIDELGDKLYPEVVLDKVGELPMLLAEAEEDEHWAPYNNGETLTGGWTGDPMFVDGSSNFLQIIGDQGTNYGSNIITTAGGPSYHLISLVEQYGENFINEEGRVSPIRPVKVAASHQDARLLNMYYGASFNIEQGNTAIDNPARSNPTVVGTHRLANSRDMLFFFEGWDQDLKERSKFRGQAMAETVGDLNEKRAVSIIRSRYAYYWFFNRRVLLVKGAA